MLPCFSIIHIVLWLFQSPHAYPEMTALKLDARICSTFNIYYFTGKLQRTILLTCKQNIQIEYSGILVGFIYNAPVSWWNAHALHWRVSSTMSYINQRSSTGYDILTWPIKLSRSSWQKANCTVYKRAVNHYKFILSSLNFKHRIWLNDQF